MLNFNGHFFISLVDCELSAWSDWNTCSESCGTAGTQQKRRTVAQESLAGGKECVGIRRDEQSCNVMKCPGILLKHFCAIILISTKTRNTNVNYKN